MPGRDEGEIEVLVIERAAGIARVDLVHALPREVAGELVHGKQGRAGVLADCDRVAAMVLMTVRHDKTRKILFLSR